MRAVRAKAGVCPGSGVPVRRSPRSQEMRLLRTSGAQLCAGERLTCPSLAFRRLISQVPNSLRNAALRLDNLARRYRRGDEGATAQAVSRDASTLSRRMTLAGQSGRRSRAAPIAPAQGATSTFERNIVEIGGRLPCRGLSW
jgi:hypothetical protein